MQRMIATLRSQAETNFTGALVQNAAATANLVVPVNLTSLGLQTRARIQSVAILSAQNLAWEVWFFGRDLFQESDIDADTFLGRVAFVANDGSRIAAAGAYYYFAAPSGILYQDQDNTREIHVMLINRSAGAKDAGAAGEISVAITMESMEL